MKTLRKYGCCIVCTFILIMLMFYGVLQSKNSVLRFSVETDFGSEEINVFEGQSGQYYVFLPSYTDMDHVSVSKPFFQEILLGGVALSEGMRCGDFRLETAYPYVVDGQEEGELWFYRSSNVATMYITSGANGMELVHQDQNHRETVSVTLYTAEGQMNCFHRAASIKGRGNSTWGFEKKPYSLRFSGGADLLGMGTAKNWVLLANMLDESNLHNKLVYDTARRISSTWVPECEYVDVYLNGTYHGLYLLSEKVEVGENRLNLELQKGDFLVRTDFEERFAYLNHPWYSGAERVFELCEPELPTADEKADIQMSVDQMEQILFSNDDLFNFSEFDLDSWVCKYLIDEVFCNLDSDLTSNYFYSMDGVFFAGPIWDYDMVCGGLGIIENPAAFYAKSNLKYSGYASPYYHALYENETFYRRMTELYRTKMLPAAQMLIKDEIPRLGARIQEASKMNSLRWSGFYQRLNTSGQLNPQSADSMKAYLSKRLDFLTSAWIEGVNYCTLQIDPYGWDTCRSVSVSYGTVFEDAKGYLNDRTWMIERTGAVFDPEMPIMEDMVLIPMKSE